MKRLTTFTVWVYCYRDQNYTTTIKLDKPKPDLAVRAVLTELKRAHQISYEDINQVFVNNTVGNTCLIRDVYNWARLHKFNELIDSEYHTH